MKKQEKALQELSLSEIIQESKKLNKQKEDNESSKMSVIILTLASLFTNIMRMVPGDYRENQWRKLHPNYRLSFSDKLAMQPYQDVAGQFSHCRYQSTVFSDRL